MGFSNLHAAPVTNQQVLEAVASSEFTYRYELKGEGTLDQLRWAPGKRARSVSFPVRETALERFMESGDGNWIAASVAIEPPSLKDLLVPSDGPSSYPSSCPWEPKSGCETPGDTYAIRLSPPSVLAVAAFSPEVLVGLIGSIVGRSNAEPLPMFGPSNAATPPPPVAVETFLAAIAVLFSGCWLLLRARKKRRRRTRAVRRPAVDPEGFIRGFVSPARFQD